VKLLCLLSIAWAFLAQGVQAQKPPALPPDATPKDIRDLIRATAEALQNKDVDGFLDHFDKGTPGYEMLHFYLEGLAVRDSVMSSIEIVTDKADAESDGQRHTMVLDWVLNIDAERTRREVVKVTVEKQGKKWKFTAIDPIEFFKPPAQ
jgi:hypothetical protein